MSQPSPPADSRQLSQTRLIPPTSNRLGGKEEGVDGEVRDESIRPCHPASVTPPDSPLTPSEVPPGAGEEELERREEPIVFLCVSVQPQRPAAPQITMTTARATAAFSRTKPEFRVM